MKLTGTNRPITYTTHHPANPFKRGSHPGVVQRNKTACVHYVVPKQQTRCLRTDNYITTPHLRFFSQRSCCNTSFPTPTPPGLRRVRTQGYGGHSVGETPGPIPNPEVKPSRADGTAWETGWESRSLPRLLRNRPPSGGLLPFRSRSATSRRFVP